MISVKEAVRQATSYLYDLTDQKAQDIRLEEVELSDDEQKWYVTLSVLSPSSAFAGRPLVAAVSPELEGLMRGERRDYKIFTIKAESGQVQSMKIRPAA